VGVVKGKFSFMAPEQGLGEEVTRRADVYAVAVVLWEMLTGRRLFTGANNIALAASVLQGATEPPSRYAPDLPPGLDALVMAGLDRDPAARFPSAVAMAKLLSCVAPPALAADVGAWVEEVAGEAVAERRAMLRNIERHSVKLPVPQRRPLVAMPPQTRISYLPSAPAEALPVERFAATRWKRAAAAGGAAAIVLAATMGLLGIFAPAPLEASAKPPPATIAPPPLEMVHDMAPELATAAPPAQAPRLPSRSTLANRRPRTGP
jgi:serine/threonine-protein kinase